MRIRILRRRGLHGWLLTHRFRRAALLFACMTGHSIDQRIDAKTWAILGLRFHLPHGLILMRSFSGWFADSSLQTGQSLWRRSARSWRLFVGVGNRLFLRGR